MGKPVQITGKCFLRRHAGEIIVNPIRVKSAKKFGFCPEIFRIKWESREILTIYPGKAMRRAPETGGNRHAGKGRDLRRQHVEAADAFKRGDDAADRALTAGRYGGQEPAGGGQSEAGFVRGAAVSEPGREPGRSVSGRLHRASEGHRQLRHDEKRPLLDLRRADDRGRAAPVSARLQPHPRQPLAARHGLPRAAVQAAADRAVRPRADDRRDRAGAGARAGARSSAMRRTSSGAAARRRAAVCRSSAGAARSPKRPPQRPAPTTRPGKRRRTRTCPKASPLPSLPTARPWPW